MKQRFMKCFSFFKKTSLSGSKSSRSLMFYKKCVLENFGKFTGEHLCYILLLIKLRSTGVLNFAKFLRTPFHRAPPLYDCF